MAGQTTSSPPVGGRQPDPGKVTSLTRRSPAGDAGVKALTRMSSGERRIVTSRPAGRRVCAQYDAGVAGGVSLDHFRSPIESARDDVPVFAANGDSDPDDPPALRACLRGFLPIAPKIYPDSAHGFLFQHHTEPAADVHAFLDEAQWMPISMCTAVEGALQGQEGSRPELAKAAGGWEQVLGDPLFLDNTAAFIPRLSRDAISNAAGGQQLTCVLLTRSTSSIAHKQLGVW